MAGIVTKVERMNMTDKQERERARLAQQIAEMMELLPMVMDLERYKAKVARAAFLALIDIAEAYDAMHHGPYIVR